MSEFVTVKITGLQELQNKLQAIPEKMARKGLRKALKAGAAVILYACVANAPKETGFMAEHFDVRTRLKSGALAGSAFVGPNSKALYPDRKETWGARTARLVAGWLEFGTAKRPKFPFMTSAFESEKAAALDAMVESIKETVAED